MILTMIFMIFMFGLRPVASPDLGALGFNVIGSQLAGRSQLKGPGKIHVNRSKPL